MTGQEPQNTLWKKWLGDERYLAFAKHAHLQPIEFAVVANQRISAAILEDCSHVEVALRNTVSRRLQWRLTQQGISGTWMADPTEELARIGSDISKRISEAERRAFRQKRAATASDVVSELTLGFWIRLFSKRAQAIRSDLIEIFEGYETRSFTPLLEGLNDLRVLRNRVAHNHRVLHRDLFRDAESILKVAGWLDSDLREFVSRQSRVLQLIQGSV